MKLFLAALLFLSSTLALAANSPIIFGSVGGVACAYNVLTNACIASGSGAVASVFGRTGTVTAQSGDYSAFYLPLSGGTMSGNIDMGNDGLLNITFLNMVSGGSITDDGNSGFLFNGGAAQIDSSGDFVGSTLNFANSGFVVDSIGEVSMLSLNIGSLMVIQPTGIEIGDGAENVNVQTAGTVAGNILALDSFSNIISVNASPANGLILQSNGGTPSWQVDPLSTLKGSTTFAMSTGALSGVSANEIVGNGKFGQSGTLRSADVAAAGFTCTGNPTFKFLDCGTSAGACTAGTTTLATATLTASNTITAATINSATITANHFWAWEITAGTCAALNATGSAEVGSALQ